MALALKNNRYYVYFRRHGKIQWRTLHTSDRKEAETLHDQYMKALRLEKQKEALMRDFPAIYAQSLQQKPQQNALPEIDTPRKIKLCDMTKVAERYRKLSKDHYSAIKRFIEATKLTYVDEVTPQIALKYLSDHYGKSNGKSFNNNKTALNTIFKLCLIESGLKSSPFADILNMRIKDVEQHRAITADEFRRLFKMAQEPWKTALLIAWHTGLRQKDCFTLTWDEIKADGIYKVPAKTARFHRAVYIPIHPELQKHLDALPRPQKSSDSVLSCFCGKNFNRTGYQGRYIHDLFVKCDVLDNASGKASFHSLRASFVTRCEAAGIPRTAIRSMVGHVSDSVTDQYSQDKKTPQMLKQLPASGV